MAVAAKSSYVELSFFEVRGASIECQVPCRAFLNFARSFQGCQPAIELDEVVDGID